MSNYNWLCLLYEAHRRFIRLSHILSLQALWGHVLLCNEISISLVNLIACLNIYVWKKQLFFPGRIRSARICFRLMFLRFLIHFLKMTRWESRNRLGKKTLFQDQLRKALLGHYWNNHIHTQIQANIICICEHTYRYIACIHIYILMHTYLHNQ